MKDIFVIDDVISKSYQDHIESFLMHNENFPWFFNPSLTNPYDATIHNKNDSYGWLHTFIDIDKGNNSSVSNLLVPLAYEACGKAKIYCKEILNARAFMMFPRDKNFEDNNIWHVDIKDPHLVCLYYVNDSSGPTTLSTVEYEKNMETSLTGNLPILQKIEPKKGRALIFDGRLYHQASNPNDGRRTIINFNFIGNV